jgi:hypothetical protein
MVQFERSNGGISEKCLAEFEQRSGILLPEQYKKFLQQQNGGRPALGEFDVPSWGDSIVNSFYGIAVGDSSDVERTMRSFSDVIPSHMIPIGNDPGGNQICIGIKGTSLGKIYFWDHESWDDDGGAETPIEIASSLEEFFTICKP